ncbi:MAG: RES family NAD+ phosphorylase [Bacteroidetes bacterium]|nr:RES family NAD+ phosphorylase [Bacteroidota bacterium]
MMLFRLAKSVYARDLSGKGAEKTGGRWNSKGTRMLYTSSSRALSMAEMAVHLPLGILPTGFEMVTLFLPEPGSILEIDNQSLPPNWRSLPFPHSTQVLGDQFVRESKSLIFKVPSAIVQGDYNYLINPLHPEMAGVNVIDCEPFVFSERMFVRK